MSRLRLERLRSQALTGPPEKSAADVVDRLLAVQAQDLRGARLAIRARSSGCTAADVDAAIDRGELVVGWLNRGTLHLVARDDYWWLHALTTPPLSTSNTTRLRQEGVDEDAAERGVRSITRALANEGPLLRAELRERVRAGGVPVDGQAMVHLLFHAALRGDIVRGPLRRSEQAWVHARDWLDPRPKRIDRDEALAALVRRYLRGHGPAAERDLAKWAGLSLRGVRAGLAGAAGDLTQRPDGFVTLKKKTHPAALRHPEPRLLGAYEPVLLGWAIRDDVLTSAAARRLVTANGLFRPFLFVDGQAVGTWRIDGTTVELDPFEPLDRQVAAALEADAADVVRFLRGS